MEEHDEILEELLAELDAGLVESFEYLDAKKSWDLGHTDIPIHLGMKRYL